MRFKYLITTFLCMIFALSLLSGCKSPSAGVSSNGDDKPMKLTEDLQKKDGIYTYYQTATPYNINTSVQTDGFKLFFLTADQKYVNYLKTFPTRYDAKVARAMITAAQDFDKYYTSGKYDGKKHDGDIIRKSDGKVWSYGLLEGLPYILPTADWNNYLISICENAIKAGVKTISLEELGVYGDTGYETSFRDAWKLNFGAEWQAPWSDPNLYFMSQDLRNILTNNQVKQVFSYIKSKYPDVKCVIANHASPSYFQFADSVGNHDIMALNVVDGIEGQTWSNTIEVPFTYSGVAAIRPFVTGFTDYSYWANLGLQFPGKEVSVITDPKGDGGDINGKTLDEYKQLYQHQIVSQLAFPNIFKYNACVWTDRAYSINSNINPISTDEYKIIMNNIISLQSQMYKYQKPITTKNKQVKVGAIMLDTACYQAGGPQNTTNNDSFYSMLSGLMYNGVMVDAIPVGSVDSKADIFKNYDIIVVGYDLMKPMNTLCNENIKRYIENGGTVIYMGGRGEYENIAYGWWKKAGFDSPQDQLFSILGCGASGRTVGIKQVSLSPESNSNIAKRIGNIKDELSAVNMIGYNKVSGATPLYKAGASTVAFEKKVGKGNFFYFGIDPNYFAMKDCGNTLFKIVQTISSEKLSKKVESQNSISYRRGPIYGFNAIGGNCTTDKGIFLNMFDENLSVIDSLDVKNGESVLLLDVSEKYKSKKPVVLYATGNNPTIIENNDITRVVTSGPNSSNGTVRIFIPKGYKISSVTATNAFNNQDALVSKTYSDVRRSLLVTYKNNVTKVIIDVKYVKG